MQKTYNIRDSPVVTHPSTSLTITGLSMGERTGSRVFQYLWSYVEDEAVVPSYDFSNMAVAVILVVKPSKWPVTGLGFCTPDDAKAGGTTNAVLYSYWSSSRIAATPLTDTDQQGDHSSRVCVNIQLPSLFYSSSFLFSSSTQSKMLGERSNLAHSMAQNQPQMVLRCIVRTPSYSPNAGVCVL